MIEPQNTTMPLPADSAPADAPQGEAGFGEMLANTLGMVPQIDPSAIQRFVPQDSEQQGNQASDLFADDESVEANRSDWPATTRHTGIPIDASGKAPDPIWGTRPPFVDAKVTGPVFPGDADPVRPGIVSVAPPPELPATPVPGDDGIWEPVLDNAPDTAEVRPDAVPTKPAAVAELPAIPVDDRTASPAMPTPQDSTPVVAEPPVSVDPPGNGEPSPVHPTVPDLPIDKTPVVGMSNPRADAAVAAVPVDVLPTMPDRKPVAPIADRGLPAQPLPTTQRPDTSPAPVVNTVVSTNPTPVPAEVSARPDIVSTTPVRVDAPPVKIDGDRPVSLGTTNVAMDSGNASSPSTAPMMAADVAPVQSSPVTNFAAPATPAMHSALAERVLSAVELQANQPPPRTMVVDIPEIEGLRLVVSVRGGAEVHVVQSSASSAVNGLQSFMDEVQSVLESRGFVMTGDGRRRDDNQHQDEDEHRPRSGRPTFRRPADNDLRI